MDEGLSVRNWSIFGSVCFVEKDSRNSGRDFRSSGGLPDNDERI